MEKKVKKSTAKPVAKKKVNIKAEIQQLSDQINRNITKKWLETMIAK
ncbi:hypothetical protein [Pedobacter sp. BS3]|nr:hypothetical protein [Pedobacter sp. BS3]